MEDHVSLIVFGNLRYLLIETSNKNLRLPSTGIFKRESFHDAAQRLLDKVAIIQ